MDKQQASGFVKRHGWLSAMPVVFQNRLLARCDLLKFAAGEVVFRAGDETGSLIGIVEGRVELHLPLQGNDPTLAHFCGAGSWLGNTAAMVGRRRRITAVAGRDGCRVLQMSRAEMLRMTQRDPKVWSYFAALHARNYLSALDVIDALKRNDPIERVAATLCNLLDALPEGEKVINSSQSDFGSLTQFGRSTINAVLTDLEKRGWVRRGYGFVEIADASALRRFVREAN